MLLHENQPLEFGAYGMDTDGDLLFTNSYLHAPVTAKP